MCCHSNSFFSLLTISLGPSSIHVIHATLLQLLSPPSFIPALQMGNFCNIASEEIIDQTRQSHFFSFIYSKKKYEIEIICHVHQREH